MLFEWDERKSEETNRRRGFDFLFAVLIFNGPVVEHEGLRYPYGERRIVAIGVVEALYLTVVYTDRPSDDVPVRRIISARLSNQRERFRYDQACP